MTTLTNKQRQAAIKLLAAICGAIKALGSVPSGHMYARVCNIMSLDQYECIIRQLENTGLIESKNNLLIWRGNKS